MIAEKLAACAAQIEARLESVLNTLEPLPLAQAMAHALRGGKRMRGFLVLESARLHHVSPELALWPACAIEAMHAYSLVHDDLPSMDDDDTRRGQPTVHVKWDEATAILAGDALQALAFELASHSDLGAVGADLAHRLARVAGARGMVLGQAQDIAAESAETPLSLPQIEQLQAEKTGALIIWSATAGAVLAGADTSPLARYASDLGLAFQIADDILDATGDAAIVGKATGKDATAGKATFVSLLGLGEAKRRAEALVQSASDALDIYGAEADTLRALARFVITRDH